MAKRHPSLIPLSREHHAALLLAFRLLQGLPPTRQPDSPQAQAQDTIRFFHTRLTTHFQAEEETLFPLIRRTLPPTMSLLDRLLAEHAEMRHSVQALEQADRPSLPARLKAFGQILRRHVRSEERDLFPMCEANLAEDDAAQLKAAIVRFLGEGR